MQLNEAITELFKHGVVEVTFGRNPENGQNGISAKQFLNAGGIQSSFQAMGDSPEDCFNAIVGKIKHTGQLQETVIKLRNGGRG